MFEPQIGRRKLPGPAQLSPEELARQTLLWRQARVNPRQCPQAQFITGLAAQTISAAERAFLREARPWGLILFKRNISTPQQVSELTRDFRDTVGWEAPVLVDQEGGRVQRLGPPHWPVYPPGARYGEIYDRDRTSGLAAARLAGHLIAADLTAVGIDTDCLPIADVPVAGGDPVIGDRAYGTEPAKVAAIAGAVAQGLLAGGVLPVLKHLPGHGRATADSHHKLPVVDTPREVLEKTDFAAFRPLAGLPLGMTAHVVFSGDRSRCTGHYFGHNGARSDSRLHRIRRTVDER